MTWEQCAAPFAAFVINVLTKLVIDLGPIMPEILKLLCSLIFFPFFTVTSWINEGKFPFVDN